MTIMLYPPVLLLAYGVTSASGGRRPIRHQCRNPGSLKLAGFAGCAGQALEFSERCSSAVTEPTATSVVKLGLVAGFGPTWPAPEATAARPVR